MTTKKHLLVISQYFYPEQFRINDMCQEWVRKGYKVTVVTGIPNYPEGKFYSGYGWLKRKKEVYEGIQIIRLPIIPRGRSSVMLMFNYMSFVISGGIWGIFTRIKANKVFVFEVSPLTQALVGIWYAGKRKVPCLIYVQDLWPENVEVVTGLHNRHVLNSISRMADYIYKNCERIFVTSPSFVKKIEERGSAYRGGKSKVIYWPQYAEEFYVPIPKKELSEIPVNETFKVIFTGNIGYAQGLEILPRAAVLLKKAGICCSFYLIGDGRYKKELEKCIQQNNVDGMFHLLGRKAPEEIPQYLGNCDVAFLSFADNSLFQMTIPAKLQSYLACGIPTIAAASGESQRIIKESKAGVVCRMGDAADLAEKIKWMMGQSEEVMAEMRENALKYSAREFKRSDLLKKMEEYLER